MGDRQDIDALLIGALYGELEGADQARLDAHLAAHPSDRAAMDALARTRATLRERISALPEFDPAPKVSTLLLQEAARRAPAAEGAGLLAWLRNMFRPLVAHPALAGALTLALVGGAAGLLYSRGRGGVAEPTADSAQDSATAIATAPAAPQSLAPSQLERAQIAPPQSKAGDDYQVNLTDEGKDKAAPAGSDVGVAAIGGVHGSGGREGEVAQQLAGKTERKKEASGTSAGGRSPGYVAVTTPEPAAKHLEEDQAIMQGQAGMGAGSAAAPAADPSAPRDALDGAPDRNVTATAFNQDKAAQLDGWAKVEHGRMTKLVQAGKCVEAGQVGGEIANRAPEYYAAHVENDRAVRQCKQYIDSEKRRRATETAKSRARIDDAELAKPAAN
jgi:anti-sigma factor RsiW